MTNMYRKAGIQWNMYSDGDAVRENCKFSMFILQIREEEEAD